MSEERNAGSGIIKTEAAKAAYTALPWPYTTLDIASVKRRGYDNYFVGGCMYATASALINTLVETVGTPWDSLPIDMFRYGSAGISGWSTTCGAIHAAAWVIQACIGTNATPVINELFHWYCSFPFPSADHDTYAAYTRQKTTIANSPLCQASSSNWSFSTRNDLNGAARKDRCAKLAGDVAGKAVELLNALKAGTYSPALVKPDPTSSGCNVGAASPYDHVEIKPACIVKCPSNKNE